MNRLHVTRATRISIDDFLATCLREVYVPIPESKVREITAALGDVEFRRFEADSRDLLCSRLFAASDTDQTRSRWMLDGNHGFVRLCTSDDHQTVEVTEMTSPRLGMRACQCGGAS